MSFRTDYDSLPHCSPVLLKMPKKITVTQLPIQFTSRKMGSPKLFSLCVLFPRREREKIAANPEGRGTGCHPYGGVNIVNNSVGELIYLGLGAGEP